MSTANSVSYISYLSSREDNPYHLNHIYEFSELSKKIALDTIQEVVPDMVKDICVNTVKEYLEGNIGNGVNYDIHSIAEISIKDFNKMFRSEAFSKFMSQAITDEIQKRINEIDFNIKL